MNSNPEKPSHEEPGLLDGNWALAYYENLNSQEKDYPPEDLPSTPTLFFHDDGKNGTMSGKTCGNRVTGEYELSEGNKIKVERFGGTKRGEPAFGMKFWKTIRLASSYSVNNERLIIYYNDDQEAMYFTPM